MSVCACVCVCVRVLVIVCVWVNNFGSEITWTWEEADGHNVNGARTVPLDDRLVHDDDEEEPGVARGGRVDPEGRGHLLEPRGEGGEVDFGARGWARRVHPSRGGIVVGVGAVVVVVDRGCRADRRAAMKGDAVQPRATSLPRAGDRERGDAARRRGDATNTSIRGSSR